MGAEVSAPAPASTEHDARAASSEDVAQPAVTMGRAASHTALSRMATEQRHARAATWQHRGQQRRTRPGHPWPGRGGSSTPALSDSESEAGFSDASGISRSGSSARVKRTFSEASDCSEMGDDSNPPNVAGRRGNSGTWPRLPKRSSRTSMAHEHDTLDVWELTRALAREKSDLADQLAHMTSAAVGRMDGGRGGPPPPPPPPPSLGHRSPWEEMSCDPRMSQLDDLVEAEQKMGTSTEVDDGTVDAILGALQDQFKPDDPAPASAPSHDPRGPMPQPRPPPPPPPLHPAMVAPPHWQHGSGQLSPLSPLSPLSQQHASSHYGAVARHAHGPHHSRGRPAPRQPLHHGSQAHGYTSHGLLEAYHPQAAAHAYEYIDGAGCAAGSFDAACTPLPPYGHHHACAAPPGYSPPSSLPAGHIGPTGYPPSDARGCRHLGGQLSPGGASVPRPHAHLEHGARAPSAGGCGGEMAALPPAMMAASSGSASAGSRSDGRSDVLPQPMLRAMCADDDSPLMLSAEQLCMYEVCPTPPAHPPGRARPRRASVRRVCVCVGEAGLELRGGARPSPAQGLFDDVDFCGEMDASVSSPMLIPSTLEKALGGAGIPLSPVLEASPHSNSTEMDGVFSAALSGSLPPAYDPSARPLAPLSGAPPSLPHPSPAASSSAAEEPRAAAAGQMAHHVSLADAAAVADAIGVVDTDDGGAGGGPSFQQWQALQQTAPHCSGGPASLVRPPSQQSLRSSVAESKDGDMGKEGPNRKEWAQGEDELILEAVRHLGCKWRQIASMLPGRSDDAVRNRWNRLKEPNNLNASARDTSNGSSAYRCSKCGQLKKNHRCTYVAPELAPASATSGSGAPSPLTKAPGGLVSPSGGNASGGADGRWQPEADGSGGGGSSEGGPPNAADGGGTTDEDRKQKGGLRIGWTKAEDEMIAKSVAELGHKWYQISERLPGRTDHAIRNRWHRLLTMRQDSLKLRASGGIASGSQVDGFLAPDGGAMATSFAATWKELAHDGTEVDISAFVNDME